MIGAPSFRLLLLGCTAAAIAGFLLSATGAIDRVPGISRIFGAPRSEGARPTEVPTVDAEQLVMIYFGASDCIWCARPETHELLRRAAAALRQTAEDDEVGFVAIGVALDRDLEAGLDHLRSLGIFDQMLSGSGRANVGAIDMFQGVMPRITGTPTVVVIRRRLNEVGSVVYSSDIQRVALEVGLQQLATWVHAGAPIRSVERRSEGSSQYGHMDSDPRPERRPSTQN
jgi:hypothetical protein